VEDPDVNAEQWSEVVRRAAAEVSLALGETGAPFDDLCPTGSCEHDTCTAVSALATAGLLNPTPTPEVTA
jgi:hypothetical protein